MATAKKVSPELQLARQKLLEQILAVWMTFPTLRLGQLLENARLSVGYKTSTCKDLFYLEDHELSQMLKDYSVLWAEKEKEKKQKVITSLVKKVTARKSRKKKNNV